jgi:hypothetical protein
MVVRDSIEHLPARVASMAIIIDAVFLQSGFT